MSPERWARIQKFFHRALELEPQQRVEYLNDACSHDQALRSEVKSMVSCTGEASNFLHAVVLELRNHPKFLSSQAAIRS